MPLDATPLTDVQQTYLAAADLLERDGWSWRRGRSSGGGRCLVVAITDAARSLVAAEAGMDYLREYLGRQPVDWNDEPGRTKEDVINLLRNAVWSAI